MASPESALTIRNSLLGGRRAGLCTGGGVATGQTIWALTTGTGAAALLQASRPAFLAVKIGGAAYLVYLGVHSLREAAHPRGEGKARSPASATFCAGSEHAGSWTDPAVWRSSALASGWQPNNGRQEMSGRYQGRVAAAGLRTRTDAPAVRVARVLGPASQRIERLQPALGGGFVSRGVRVMGRGESRHSPPSSARARPRASAESADDP